MTDRASTTRIIGLIVGPVLGALVCALLPAAYTAAGGEDAAFTFAGRATLGLMVWMATWWLTEALHVSITALVPIVVLPIVTIAEFGSANAAAGAAAAPYAHRLLFLFAGGFLLGLSMSKCGLDKRIALLTLRFVGTKPVNMIGGFMIATAVMSAFVSNTATAAMMLPIAMSVVALVRERSDAADDAVRDFAVGLLLAIAYAASIGGIATIIGSPPNAILVGFLESTIDEAHRTEISFARWLAIGAPITAIMLPATWLMLTRVLHRPRVGTIAGGRDFVRGALRELGPASLAERATFIVFICTALAWITRPLLVQIEIGGVHPLAGLSDPVIAMIGGGVLFVIPVDLAKRKFVMDWATARTMEWGVLILFGGGLSLAAAVDRHGVADFIGAQASAFGALPTIALMLVTVAGMIFLTELTSNTASTATLVPVLAAVAIGLGVHPYLLVVPAAIAASCAFMLPVATPPNAIVFASGEVEMRDMVRAGVWLNLIGIVVVTVVMYVVVGMVLGT